MEHGKTSFTDRANKRSYNLELRSGIRTVVTFGFLVCTILTHNYETTCSFLLTILA